MFGGVVGLCLPRVAYRLSVEYRAPSRLTCAACSRPFPTGLPGWLSLLDRPSRPDGPSRPDRWGRAGLLGRRGWGWQAARCPGCRVRQGPSPWLTVLVSAATFGALGWALGPATALPAYLVVAGYGVLLGAIDLACLRLPDPLVGSAFAAAAALLTLAATVDGTADRLLRAGFAAATLVGTYLILAILPRSALGFGDVKLAGVLGLTLGWLGWPAVLLGLVLPHLLGGPVALALLVSGRAKRRTELPFGPALLAGALLAVVFTTKLT
jgi:leader peptidase (prepilin peptidase)/N-methyltransferase